MSVKLLPKQEIANIKAKEQTRVIQEGVKIATRIDGLRETWSKTEQDFERYKVSTLAAIQKEISELEAQKEKLAGEIRHNKEIRDSILSDLSQKQSELDLFEKRLMAWDKKLTKREEKIALTETETLEALDAAQSSQIMSEDNERITANLLKQANDKKVEAENTLQEARKVHEKALSFKEETESNLNLRESELEKKEKELLMNQMNLASDRKLLAIEKVKVNDQRQTLERAMNRLAQGKPA